MKPAVVLSMPRNLGVAFLSAKMISMPRRSRPGST
jgi:hypothetical protein